MNISEKNYIDLTSHLTICTLTLSNSIYWEEKVIFWWKFFNKLQNTLKAYIFLDTELSPTLHSSVLSKTPRQSWLDIWNVHGTQWQREKKKHIGETCLSFTYHELLVCLVRIRIKLVLTFVSHRICILS